MAELFPACSAEQGSLQRVRSKHNQTVHLDTPRCLKIRCRCREILEELLPDDEIIAEPAPTKSLFQRVLSITLAWRRFALNLWRCLPWRW